MRETFAITSQVHRIGNLRGINTVVVAVGGGVNPFNAVGNMNKVVQNSNGTILKSITAFRNQHNLNIQGEASKITP